MQSFRIIFAGTPLFALPSLITLQNSPHRVVGVFTQPDRPAGRGQKVTQSPVKQFAKQQGISIYQPDSLKTDAVYEIMQALCPDVLVVVAYGQLIPKAIFSLPPLGTLNVHASLLPRWRGAAPIYYALRAGDAQTGVSIMRITQKLDAGDVLGTRSCDISDHDTTATLQEKLAVLGADLLIEVLENLEGIVPRPQDPRLVTYAPKLKKDMGHINWASGASDIDRQIRACNPFPVAFTYFQGQVLRIWEAGLLQTNTDLAPGTLTAKNRNGFDIATGRGDIRILKVQLPGKRLQGAADFVNAYQELLIPGKTSFS